MSSDMTPTPAALVALLREAADHADTSAILDEAVGASAWSDESRALATRLRAAALAREEVTKDMVAEARALAQRDVYALATDSPELLTESAVGRYVNQRIAHHLTAALRAARPDAETTR